MAGANRFTLWRGAGARACGRNGSQAGSRQVEIFDAFYCDRQKLVLSFLSIEMTSSMLPRSSERSDGAIGAGTETAENFLT